eukprot:3145-Heterococcus_DN1.PRE.4
MALKHQAIISSLLGQPDKYNSNGTVAVSQASKECIWSSRLLIVRVTYQCIVLYQRINCNFTSCAYKSAVVLIVDSV